MKKNFFDDLVERLTSWKTNAIGFMALLISVLVFFKVIQPDKADPLVNQFQFIFESVLTLLTAIAGFINLFKKDNPT